MLEYQLFQARQHEMHDTAAHERAVSTALRARRADRRARREARDTRRAA